MIPNGPGCYGAAAFRQAAGPDRARDALAARRDRGGGLARRPLPVVLDRSGITREAVDVMPYGLDPDYVSGGVNYGPVRRILSHPVTVA